MNVDLRSLHQRTDRAVSVTVVLMLISLILYSVRTCSISCFKITTSPAVCLNGNIKAHSVCVCCLNWLSQPTVIF